MNGKFTLRKLIMAIIFAALALTTLNPAPAKAYTLWWVAPGGNDLLSCTSLATACRTIQAAINKAASGDNIHVEAGTYSTSSGESFPITINKTVSVFGVSYLTTIVDATGSGQNVFSIGGYSIGCYISSFTIQGGTRGIECIGYTPTYIGGYISNNRITGNSIGIYTAQSRGEIRGNDISGNTNYGIYNDYASDYSGPVIKRNGIGFNCTGGILSYEAGIYNYHSSSAIENNLIGWNNGSGIYNNNASPSIMNNTISVNYGGSGVASFNSSSPQITNNIITSNGLFGIHTDNVSLANTYNDVWANAYGNYFGTSAGTGSISKDPRFVSFWPPDAHLMCSSPAINAGTNTGAPSLDFDSLPRPVGGIVDMGAYEKQTDLYCPIYLPLIKK